MSGGLTGPVPGIEPESGALPRPLDQIRFIKPIPVVLIIDLKPPNSGITVAIAYRDRRQSFRSHANSELCSARVDERVDDVTIKVEHPGANGDPDLSEPNIEEETIAGANPPSAAAQENPRHNAQKISTIFVIRVD